MDSKTETVSEKTHNEILAQFMKITACTDPSHLENKCYWFASESGYLKSDEMKYQTSWEWIMPVWIKFRNLNLDLEGEYGKWINSLQWYLFSSDEPKIFAERLAYAIKWYNSQSTATIKIEEI